jgi:hypothetical protein
MSIVLRRSSRKYDQLLPYYVKKYNEKMKEIYLVLDYIDFCNRRLKLSYIETINNFGRLIRLTNESFSMLVYYGKEDLRTLCFIRMIYHKTFEWIELSTKVNNGRVLRRFIKNMRKIRTNYELFRDDFWDGIIRKYSLNDDIICLIEKYLD